MKNYIVILLFILLGCDDNSTNTVDSINTSPAIYEGRTFNCSELSSAVNISFQAVTEALVINRYRIQDRVMIAVNNFYYRACEISISSKNCNIDKRVNKIVQVIGFNFHQSCAQLEIIGTVSRDNMIYDLEDSLDNYSEVSKSIINVRGAGPSNYKASDHLKNAMIRIKDILKSIR